MGQRIAFPGLTILETVQTRYDRSQYLSYRLTFQRQSWPRQLRSSIVVPNTRSNLQAAEPKESLPVPCPSSIPILSTDLDGIESQVMSTPDQMNSTKTSGSQGSLYSKIRQSVPSTQFPCRWLLLLLLCGS